MNILGDFYEKLPGDKTKRTISRDFGEGQNDWQEDFGKTSQEMSERDEKKDRRSFAWLYIMLGIVAVVLSVKLWSLQVVHGAYYQYLAEGNRIRTRNIPAPRGVIYDRNGKILARNIASFNVELYPVDLPRDKEEQDKLIAKVAKLTKISPKIISDKIDKNDQNPLYPIVLKEKVSRSEALILKEKFAQVRAVSVAETLIRSYENRWGLAHILGYVGKVSQDDLEKDSSYFVTDDVGKTGLEASLEQELRGVDGREEVEVDASGKIVRVLATQEPQAGHDIKITIDFNLQKNVYSELKKEAATKGGKGAVVATNPQNGEILAMVSLPDYNNNIFTKLTGKKFSEAYQKLVDDKNQPMFDRAIGGVYPSGSTIKPVMAASALQEKVIDINTTIFDPGLIEVPNKYDPSIVYKFHDWKVGGHGYVNVLRGIQESCDTFFYAVGGGYDKISGMGIKNIDKYYQLFGLGARTGIDLPGEASGLVPSPEWKEKYKNEPWVLGDNYLLAIGQGDLLVTPLQLLMATASVANGGELLQPHLEKEILSRDGKVLEKKKKELQHKRFISQKNIDIVRQGMRLVVTSGTATLLNSLPVPAAGKTGTAEFNGKKSLHAWFTAFAPYENPSIALAVLVEGGGEGNEVSAPIANEILRYYFTRK